MSHVQRDGPFWKLPVYNCLLIRDSSFVLTLNLKAHVNYHQK